MLGFCVSAGLEATLLELPRRRRHPFHRRQPEQDTRDVVPFVNYQKKMLISKPCEAMGERYLGPTRSSVRNVTLPVNEMDRGIAVAAHAPPPPPGVGLGEQAGQKLLAFPPLGAQARSMALRPHIDENQRCLTFLPKGLRTRHLPSGCDPEVWRK
jgi:hypothetical protein